jgi:hypothetical protein
MNSESSEPRVRNSLVRSGALDEGDSVLVRGPALSGKYGLLLELLGAFSEHALLVSTSRQAGGVRTDFARYGDPDALAVVDAGTRVHGEDGLEDSLVRYASSPRDLTSIGVKFTDLIAVLREEASAPVPVGVHSLSELLMYWDVERVFQFVRVMIGECRGLDWPMMATVDDSTADDQEMSTLAHPFDAVVVTRVAADGGQEFKLTRKDADETEWKEF